MPNSTKTTNLTLLEALSTGLPIARAYWPTFMDPSDSIHLSTLDALATDWKVKDTLQDSLKSTQIDELAYGNSKVYFLTEGDLKAFYDGATGSLSFKYLLEQLKGPMNV